MATNLVPIKEDFLRRLQPLQAAPLPTSLLPDQFGSICVDLILGRYTS